MYTCIVVYVNPDESTVFKLIKFSIQYSLKIRKIPSSIQGRLSVQLIGYAGSNISKTFSLNLSIKSIDFPVAADAMSGINFTYGITHTTIAHLYIHSCFSITCFH